MRIDFCTFINAGGNEVTINPLQVRYFAALDDETTIIYFDGDLSVVVSASRRRVEEGLTIDG